MEFKGTKGEWKVNVTDQTNVFEIISRRPNEREDVCIVNSELDEDAEANAKLIAAAPDLLEACIKASEFIKADYLLNAINKATK